MPTDVEKDATLTAAIEKAVGSQDKSDVVVESQQTEDTKEDKKEEKKEPEIDLDAENGKILVQALKDPQKALGVIDFLARSAGYTKETVTTKAEVREAKADINEILERNLGEEFKFLAPKLGPAITEALNKLLEGREESNDLRVRVERQELKEIQNETAETHVRLSQEWFGSDEMPQKVVDAMSAAMDEFPPTDPNMTPERYYSQIFKMVAGDMGLQKRSGNTSDKVTRSRQDSVARNLSSQNRGVVPETGGGATSRKLSLKDAVSLALEQVDQSSKK